MFRVSSRLARLQLFGIGIGCFGIAAIIVVSGRLAAMSASGGLALLGILGGIGITSILAAIRLSRTGVVRVALETLAFAAALIAADALLRVVAPEPTSGLEGRVWDARKLGIPFDGRMKSEVVAALRAKGDDALPGISRDWPRQPYIRQQLPDDLFPLSHAANAEIVECNEGGKYLVYRTDEVGFNNPLGLVLSGKVDVAAVGSSITLGQCAPDGQSLVAHLRQAYPRLADFGMPGSHALSMLATFREYVEPLKPRLVLWVMHAPDADMTDELADPILSRYLEPDFSQHLLARRAQIDQVWRSIAIPVQYELDYRTRVTARTILRDRYAGILSLSAIRWRLHLNELLAKRAQLPDLDPFKHAIALARETTRSWGGRFVVALMPTYDEVVTRDGAEPLRHELLARTLRDMGVEVIDAAPSFLHAPDPSELYVMGRNNHPTPAGNQILAQTLVNGMRADEANGRLAASGLRH
jgi:hypothetical protein